MEDLSKTNKLRLTSDFFIGHHGGWRGHIKQNDNNWIFHSYKGTRLGNYMLCASIKSDKEEKEEDLLNSNHIINLKIFITSIDKF